MLNFNPELADPVAVLRNQRAAADHIDDDYFVWRLSPGDFTASVVFPGVLFQNDGDCAVMTFLDAITSAVQFNRRRPKLWLAGRFLVEFDYTSGGVGVANFGLNVQVFTMTKTQLTTAVTNLGPGALAFPGPAVANTPQQVSSYTTSSLAGNAHIVGLRIFRDGLADANNNPLSLITVTLTFVPAVREAHV